jgi:hypothetical protein
MKPIIDSKSINEIRTKFEGENTTKVRLNLVNTDGSFSSPIPTRYSAQIEYNEDVKEEEVKEEEWNPEVNIFEQAKIMEYLMSAELICPVCKQKTLEMYNKSNMPVIDLVCKNTDDHTKHSNYFQVKTKLGKGSNYFSKENKYIHPGSIKWGKKVHDITTTDKDLLVNYICICLDVLSEGDNSSIISTESFIILPDKEQDGPYYEYIDNNRKITWNDNCIEEDVSIMFLGEGSFWYKDRDIIKLKFVEMFGRIGNKQELVGLLRRSSRIAGENEEIWIDRMVNELDRMLEEDRLHKKKYESDEDRLIFPDAPDTPHKRKRDNEEENKRPVKKGGGNKYYNEYLKCLKKYKQLKASF